MSDGKKEDGVIVNHTIVDAIFTRHWLQFRIGPKIFVVEPHAYGVTHDGHHELWAWNLIVAGSDPTVQAGWARYRSDEMRDVQVLSEKFEGPRPDYTRANTTMRTRHAQL